MFIPNFNKDKATFQQKKYIQDLKIKTESLLDEVFIQNPQYEILNSMTTKKPIGIEDLAIKLCYDEGKYFHCFLINNLTYHKGFYNNSIYGNGALGYWYKDGETTKIASLNNIFDTFEYNPNTTTVVVLNSPLDFLAGYCCVLNKKPIGDITDIKNKGRTSPSSYLIYPLSSGSFYSYQSGLGPSLKATWEKNTSGSFITSVLFKITNSYRFWLKATDNNDTLKNGYWGSLGCNITNNGEVTPYIADLRGNPWLGEPIITEVHNIDTNTHTDEEVFCDINQAIVAESVLQTRVYNLSITTNIKDENNYKVVVY